MDWWKSLARKRRTLAGLSPADRRILRQALTLMPVTALSLRVAGLAKTRKWVDRTVVNRGGPAGAAAGGTGSFADAYRLARLVRVARRYHAPWVNCLSHSLTLWALLRREGIPAEVRVGARRKEGKFEAHAWVEHQGEVLNDAETVRAEYATFGRPLAAR